MLASVTLLPALLGFVGPQHRQVRPPAPQAARGRDQGVGLDTLEPRDPAPPVAGGDHRARWCCSSSSVPLLSMRLGFTDAGNRPDRRHHAPGLRPRRRRLRPGLQRPAAAGGGDARRRGGPRHAQRAQRRSCNEHEGRRLRHPAAGERRGHGRRDAGLPHHATAGRGHRRPREPAARRRRPVGRRDGAVDVKVGGLTAAADDFASYTAARLPIFMGAVLILSFLLLMVVFRSLLVPLKAVIMNLLSIGAAYGVVVAVFQWGWGASLIGVGREAPDRGVGTDDHLRHRVRALDGLRGVPPVAHPGGVRPHRRQRHRRRRRPRAHRPRHHRRRADHVLRVRQLRARGPRSRSS